MTTPAQLVSQPQRPLVVNAEAQRGATTLVNRIVRAAGSSGRERSGRDPRPQGARAEW